MLEREAVAKTAWGEASIMGKVGMQATINTIMNRYASGILWWGVSPAAIALHSDKHGIHQYSCWNEKDNKNLPAIYAVKETDPRYAMALQLADQALSGNLPDITHGATHYLNHRIVHPLPSWCATREPVAVFEPHWYYRVIC